MSDYHNFIHSKSQYTGGGGFAPVFMPDVMFDFQQFFAEYSCINARTADLLDCGMGKTLIQEVWAENVVRKTNGRVLILTPLAVSPQTVSEGEKFGIEITRSKAGVLPSGKKIIVTNYEQLKHFNPDDFVGCVCDESSILKSFDGVLRGEITEFMRRMQFRLLCTATAAPNDYIELGTSSEALGYLGHMDMLNRFFKNDMNNSAQGRVHGKVIQWRFKGYAEDAFWKYVVSWMRAARKPSDLGFDDMVDGSGLARPFLLPELIETEHLMGEAPCREGMLFPVAAVGLAEQRDERRVTIKARCERLAELVDGHDASLVWCHLNPEGDLLEKLIPDCVQVSGRDSDDAKEEKFMAFARGQIRRLVTKPKIGAWGLNFQHCAHQATFPTNSFEQYYQGVRRSWRFGQKRKVHVDIVMTEGDRVVMDNQKRKAAQAERMFESLVERMNEQIGIERGSKFTKEEALPAWL